jgi:hypothetical protein
VALLGGLAACSSVGDEGATGGNDAAAGGGGAGPLNAPPPDSPEARACSTDADCIVDVYDRPVASTADCYCPTCALVPLNKSTNMAYELQWIVSCRDDSSTAHCTALPCPAGPLALCVSGLCLGVSRFMPASCPAPTGTGCPQGGATCGNGCCGPGEWCDDTVQICRCGQGIGCDAGDYCAPPDQTQTCGDTCLRPH